MSRPENLDAWAAYHLGLARMYRFDQAGAQEAAALFELAIAREPSFARAYAGLSFAHFERGFWVRRRPGQAAERARRIAEASLELEPLDPFCNLVMGRAAWLTRRPGGTCHGSTAPSSSTQTTRRGNTPAPGPAPCWARARAARRWSTRLWRSARSIRCSTACSGCGPSRTWCWTSRGGGRVGRAGGQGAARPPADRTDRRRRPRAERKRRNGPGPGSVRPPPAAQASRGRTSSRPSPSVTQRREPASTAPCAGWLSEGARRIAVTLARRGRAVSLSRRMPEHGRSKRPTRQQRSGRLLERHRRRNLGGHAGQAGRPDRAARRGRHRSAGA